MMMAFAVCIHVILRGGWFWICILWHFASLIFMGYLHFPLGFISTSSNESFNKNCNGREIVLNILYLERSHCQYSTLRTCGNSLYVIYSSWRTRLQYLHSVLLEVIVRMGNAPYTKNSRQFPQKCYYFCSVGTGWDTFLYIVNQKKIEAKPLKENFPSIFFV